MSAFREHIPKWVVLFSLSILLSATNVLAQALPETPKEKPAAAPQEKPAEPPNAAQIELLETKYRFEANGDSRKEVHALVKINSIENQADDIFDMSIERLFETEPDAKEVIKKREIYQVMEIVTDKCEDAANVIESIIIKYA